MTVSKAARQYRSPLRQEQAQRTRTAILDAAGELFVTKGFAATTMKDVAAAAGVSVESVYAQGSKADLLLTCVDRALAGDDEDTPVIEREQVQTLLADPDVRVKLDTMRSVLRSWAPASAPMMEAFRAAAAADPKMAEQWRTYDRRRYADCERTIEAFAPYLRPGLSVTEATDVFYAMLSPAMVQTFVADRQWDADRFARWFVDSMERLLLSA
jgi:AcrR family transcriptional regulator